MQRSTSRCGVTRQKAASTSHRLRLKSLRKPNSPWSFHITNGWTSFKQTFFTYLGRRYDLKHSLWQHKLKFGKVSKYRKHVRQLTFANQKNSHVLPHDGCYTVSGMISDLAIFTQEFLHAITRESGSPICNLFGSLDQVSVAEPAGIFKDTWFAKQFFDETQAVGNFFWSTNFLQILKTPFAALVAKIPLWLLLCNQLSRCFQNFARSSPEVASCRFWLARSCGPIKSILAKPAKLVLSLMFFRFQDSLF